MHTDPSLWQSEYNGMKTNWNHPQFSIHDKLCVNGLITTKKKFKKLGTSQPHSLTGYASWLDITGQVTGQPVFTLGQKLGFGWRVFLQVYELVQFLQV